MNCCVSIATLLRESTTTLCYTCIALPVTYYNVMP